MFAKIEVNGDAASDLYKFLKSQKQEEDGNEDIPWNFSKFLVDGSGNVVERFPPTTTPEQVGEVLTKVL